MKHVSKPEAQVEAAKLAKATKVPHSVIHNTKEDDYSVVKGEVKGAVNVYTAPTNAGVVAAKKEGKPSDKKAKQAKKEEKKATAPKKEAKPAPKKEEKPKVASHFKKGTKVYRDTTGSSAGRPGVIEEVLGKDMFLVKWNESGRVTEVPLSKITTEKI